MKRPIVLISLLAVISVQAAICQPAGYPYKSLAEFRKAADQIGNISDPAQRENQVKELWDKLKADNQIPFRLGDSVAFLYKGEANTVSWAGDFNDWKPAQPGNTGTKSGQSDIWIAVQKFPVDARLDYKIVVDDKWILDPDNPYRQMSGMGPNSELHMPGWKFPDETKLSPDVIRGNLSDNILIKSEKLGYQVNYKVYTPYNYVSCESLPVIYVTDGQDYAEDEKGAMLVILDNLIYAGEIKPVIAVFLDPREPGNDKNNRRMQEYVCNQKYADFIGDELVPLIDKSYKTHACPDDRAILGTSLGGMNSAWFGAVRINDFHLLGIQSPAFNKTVLDRFARLDWLPFRVYMTTGVINDTQQQALEMKQILEKNKVDFVYREVNEGHSWGNWRALLGDMLRWFFPM
ncbi:MAG: alpha/beta hydrolase-fold protein [Bacteroidia bacterium]|nr:alpha/beta hydrolase-fold protein [Bacteroidia bacterium]